jgi:hypothetical protein
MIIRVLIGQRVRRINWGTDRGDWRAVSGVGVYIEWVAEEDPRKIKERVYIFKHPASYVPS